MRFLHRRGYIADLDRARNTQWRRLSNIQLGAEVTEDAKPGTVFDGSWLQLLSQSFMPSSHAEFISPVRPTLSNQPAAADLVKSQTTGSQPLYDLSTFLETSVPQAGVRPRNPGYNWRSWARSRLLAPYDQAPKPYVCSSEYEEQLALLAQLDAHMQFSAPRQTIATIAKLELAHMWHHQQHDLRGGDGGGGVAAWHRASGSVQVAEQTRAEGRGHKLAAPELNDGADPRLRDGLEADGAVAAAPAASQGVAGTALVGDGASHADAADPDDIFAAADRRARVRDQQHEQHLAQAAAARDPISALPANVQLRLRELQRRAEAYSHTKGVPLEAVVRNVGEAFGQRVSQMRPAQDIASPPSTDGAGPRTVALPVLRSAAGAAAGMEPPQQVNAADRQLGPQVGPPLGPQGTHGPSPWSFYWAEHPLLSYGDSVLALAVRRKAAERLEAAVGRDGRASLATAVASLSAPRQSQSAAPLGSPPVLTLLLDYLKLKYLDVLHSWEVAARLQEATGRAEQEAARQRATMTVQVEPLLPAAVRKQLSGAWSQAAASFRPQVLGALVRSDDGAVATMGAELAAVRQAGQRALAAPLDWSHAEAMLMQDAAGGHAGTRARTPVSATPCPLGELGAVVQQAMAPVLTTTVARHQALRGHIGGTDGSGRASAAAADAGAVALKTSPSAAGPASEGAADVVFFRETLMLDASSAFEDSSHDFRVTLEFDVDRLAALEPALGGRWGVRFLERLLLLPEPSDTGRRRRSAGSMTGRARRGATARAALLGAVYPIDVVRRFCPRTRTASLTSARYPSREGNRKVVLEHYSALLRAVTLAACGASPQ